MNDTRDRVAAILREHLGVTNDQITDETRLCPPDGEAHQPGEGHLGCDSLDIVELTMAFEEEFRIEITDDESAKLNDGTVADAVALVDSKRVAEAA